MLEQAAWIPYSVIGLLAYTLFCSLLRFQRRDAKLKHYGFTDRQSLARMTNTEALEIVKYMSELEFTNAGKRYADTDILIQEFSGHHPKSARVIKALARMNYIHSHYQKAGKISNSDLLYTLSVFVTEPIAWVVRYEWRAMTPMEIGAVGTFWKGIGDAMGIRYEGFLEKRAWVDGVEYYEDLKAWAQKYEREFMVPAQSNKTTADELVPQLLFYVPKSMKAAGAHIVGVMMGERLRTSMMYSTPPAAYFHLVTAIFGIRRFILRYLALPRPSFMRVRELSDSPDPKTGRYHSTRYIAHPFYNKPTLRNRWGPEGLFVRLFGGDVPSAKGDTYLPAGYLFEEVGHKGMKKNKGRQETRLMEEKLTRERLSGCLFAFRR